MSANRNEELAATEMANTLARLQAIVDDELSLARAIFRKSIAQKCARAGLSGNRFSTSLSTALDNLGKDDLRRRVGKILECASKLPDSSMAALNLEDLIAWAEQQLSQEATDIETQVASVNMGRVTRQDDFLEDTAQSSSRRLSAELASLHTARRESDLDEAPWFVRTAKWLSTRGSRNLHWIGLGLLLLVALGLIPILLPARIASLLGMGEPAEISEKVNDAQAVWQQNWLTINEPLPWMGSSDGTSATNREQFLGVLTSLELSTIPEIDSLRDKLVEAVRTAPPKVDDALYNMGVSPNIQADLRTLRRAIRGQAIVVGVQIEGRE